ncbi:MAG: hypothetical protein LBS62_03260, partial [Clostridiales bacterium]|nr:hypothetical protein [Clostridiales bacterium]
MRKPELVAPAGDFEKLKFAVAYGADAVYLGGSALTLRAKAKNFTGGSGPAGGSGPSGSGLAEAVEYARARGVKTYCAVNAFARDRDFDNLDVYLRFLRSVNIDALIV